MNGSISPSGRSSSSGTATPTTPRESVSSTTSPSPLSQPVQTADHKQDYEFGADVNTQTNIGRMPRHEEELSPKNTSAKFYSKQTRSENERLSVKGGDERSNDMVEVSGDVDRHI
jgi:hypothetical protein